MSAEGQPTEEPAGSVLSADGTAIALFTAGSGPPLLLVHGTAGDHSAFRTLGPLLSPLYAVHSVDRRGRGASGDTLPYSIEREFDDVAAVAEHLAGATRTAIDVFGHSYGGRAALGAARRTDAIGRVICYEGAPAPPGRSYGPAGIAGRLRERLDAGDRDGLLAMFMAEVVGMSETDLAAYRTNPVWPVRAATAATIVRELESEGDPSASIDALGAVRQPVLQLLGSDSLPVFAEAVHGLDDRLQDGRVAVIDGARHAAHHTHPGAVVDALATFLT